MGGRIGGCQAVPAGTGNGAKQMGELEDLSGAGLREGREGEGRQGRSEGDVACFKMEMGRTGGGESGKQGDSCWRRAGATAEARRGLGGLERRPEM